MTVSAVQISVSTTPVKLDSGTTAESTELFHNTSAATVYVGAAGVTASTGFALAQGDSISADLGQVEDVYGVTASGTAVVHVFRQVHV